MRSAVRVLCLAAVAIAARLEAHPLSVSYSRFATGDRQVEAVVRLPLDDLDLLLRLDADLDGTVSEEELLRAHAAIARYLGDRVRLKADGAEVGPSLKGVTIWKDRNGFPYVESRLAYEAPRPIGVLEVQARPLTDLYPDHRNLAEIEFAGQREEFVFQHGNTYTAERGGRRLWRTAVEFARLGVEHIFTGYDHILFLFGLLLVAPGFRNLVLIVTSFTIAHSLTLCLATLGVVEPPSRLIEPAIALTIAYVGVENLFLKDVRHRWVITFAFGLVHGFGFASVLREMDLSRGSLATSLFTFNLGVEVGQVVIVALMWPLLRLLERTPHRRLITRAASSVIIGFGLFWFYQRLA